MFRRDIGRGIISNHCRARATFRIGTAEPLVPKADDEDFDYAIIDFLGAVAKPNLTRFDIVFGHAGDQEALDLLERESFRGRSFEITVIPFD